MTVTSICKACTPLLDVTECKLLNEAVQQNNIELEMAKSVAGKANLAKSNFLSSISHKPRTPLNAVLSFGQRIDSGNAAPTPLQKRSTDLILQAGWYLLELFIEILELALIESDNLMMTMPDSVLLTEVMAEC